LGRDLDDLEQGPKDASSAVGRARDKTIGLVHGEHHGAEIVGLENGVAGFEALQAF